MNHNYEKSIFGRLLKTMVVILSILLPFFIGHPIVNNIISVPIYAENITLKSFFMIWLTGFMIVVIGIILLLFLFFICETIYDTVRYIIYGKKEDDDEGY